MEYNQSDFQGHLFKPSDPSTIDSYNFDVKIKNKKINSNHLMFLTSVGFIMKPCLMMYMFLCYAQAAILWTQISTHPQAHVHAHKNLTLYVSE